MREAINSTPIARLLSETEAQQAACPCLSSAAEHTCIRQTGGCHMASSSLNTEEGWGHGATGRGVPQHV